MLQDGKRNTGRVSVGGKQATVVATRVWVVAGPCGGGKDESYVSKLRNWGREMSLACIRKLSESMFYVKLSVLNTAV